MAVSSRNPNLESSRRPQTRKEHIRNIYQLVLSIWSFLSISHSCQSSRVPCLIYSLAMWFSVKVHRLALWLANSLRSASWLQGSLMENIKMFWRITNSLIWFSKIPALQASILQARLMLVLKLLKLQENMSKKQSLNSAETTHLLYYKTQTSTLPSNLPLNFDA